MVPAPKKNEFNLVPRPAKARPTLEDMRRKLAAGAPESNAKPQERRKRRGPGRKSLLWTMAGTAVLIGLNAFALSRKDVILEAVGVQTFSAPLAPPSGLSLDDRARFWAYAAFDNDKLRRRFKIPASAGIDAVDAQHHVEDMLTRELGMSARAEILALKQPIKEAAR
jgi:hypothetical protein